MEGDCFYRTVAANWSSDQMIHKLIRSSGGVMKTGENKKLREKPVPVLLCPPKFPHGLS